VIVLAGGDLVLPDRVLPNASIAVENDRIAAIEARARIDSEAARVVGVQDCYVVPGFIDVHVHGVEGYDSLDPGDALAAISSRLPRYGVTAFCPTTVACAPDHLRAVLAQVAKARVALPGLGARVLPAHIESNFINPDYRGAQPLECLRLPRSGRAVGPTSTSGSETGGDYSGADILEVIAAARADVGIVTLAPELPGGMELVRALVASGHRVSLGHTGATLEVAMAAIEAGARHATHLFNGMAPMSHRTPGVAAAVLSSDEIAAELICDGYHVHPAMGRLAVTSKGVDRVMAITDGTAGSGLPIGTTTRLGTQRIHVTDRAAVLDDGTLAGSTLTMDRAFGTIVSRFGFSVVEAARLCSTTPARELALTGLGVLALDAYADMTVLDHSFRVVRTFVGGREVYAGQK
jgi:N-acetylglucosamine-6-phosphate deacetylase